MNKIYLKVCAILCILFVSSCTVENSLFERIEEKNFTLEQARANFENNAEDLKLVSFLQSQNLNKARTKSDGETDWENIVPDWENAVSGQTESGIAFMVPISLSAQTKGRFNINYGKYHTYFFKDHEVKCYLVVEQTNEGEIRRFITTGIGSSTLINDPGQPFLYTGSRSHFNGLFIISDETGHCLDAHFYCSGKSYELYAPSDNCDINLLNRTPSIGVSVSNLPILTKGGGDGNITSCYDYRYCPICNEITQWEITNDIYVCTKCGTDGGYGGFFIRCPNCQHWIDDCICGNGNNEPTDDLEICNICGRYKKPSGVAQGDLTIYCQCDSNSNPGGTGNGGGNNNSTGYIPNSSDIMVNNNILTTFIEQSGSNSGLANCIAYLLNNYGIQVDEDDVFIYLRNYYVNLGYDTMTATLLSAQAMDYGIPYSDWQGFVSYTFTTDQYSGSIENAVDGGSFVLIHENNMSNYFSIVIVGYKIDNTWIYYDPIYGFLRDNESHSLNYSDVLIITGLNN